jgi:hypothetical protein
VLARAGETLRSVGLKCPLPLILATALAVVPIPAGAQDFNSMVLGALMEKVRHLCTMQWGTNSGMQDRCEKSQIEAATAMVKLLARPPPDIPQDKATEIFSACFRQWRTANGLVDFEQANLCAEKQVAALRERREIDRTPPGTCGWEPETPARYVCRDATGREVKR